MALLPASHPRPEERIRIRAVLRGTVQGLGFRPFVYGRATALGVGGFVANGAEGLIVEAEGPAGDVVRLLDQLQVSPPPHARVLAVDTMELPTRGERRFAIRPSALAGARSGLVLPDLATCADCLAETFDPSNRRHRYPFTNCTRCGPRYSIVLDLPYDRERTTMRSFSMCAACRAEYDDPGDRRFHAEPNACPDCGPRLESWDAAGRVLHTGHDALLAATQALRDGRIVALKGLGGFQLLACAQDDAAVQSLRRRKARPAKPFAVMFPSLEAIAACARVDAIEASLLTGAERPIVLLERHGGSLAAAIAPGSHLLGAMLPYTPLHHLLLGELDSPLLATSGNRAGEPIVIDEREALLRLAGIADLFLVHDRPIARPLDDSVTRVVCGRPLVLRAGRGYAPTTVPVDDVAAGVLAVGGHLKTTVALTTDTGVLLGPHIGDLDTPLARDEHRRATRDLVQLQAIAPVCHAHDAHPDYATTQALRDRRPTTAVPHHLAHVVAGVAEHGIELPVLGVACDGGGHGDDGTIWGGEFLLVERHAWRRVARLRPFPLPGGEAAMREPRRAALGLLFAAFGAAAFERTELAPLAAFTGAELGVLRTMLLRGVNAPLTSSVGRLFDAFAALAGLVQRASHEGEAAARLEGLVPQGCAAAGYSFPLRDGPSQGARDAAPLIEIDWQPALETALADLATGSGAGAVATAFHAGLARAIAAVASRVGEPRVLLTGGCFQNARLTELAVAALREANREPHWHARVPPNDGGLALGQAVWAAWQRGAESH